MDRSIEAGVPLHDIACHVRNLHQCEENLFFVFVCGQQGIESRC